LLVAALPGHPQAVGPEGAHPALEYLDGQPVLQ